jgi:hypothetical protein
MTAPGSFKLAAVHCMTVNAAVQASLARVYAAVLHDVLTKISAQAATHNRRTYSDARSTSGIKSTQKTKHACSLHPSCIMHMALMLNGTGEGCLPVQHVSAIIMMTWHDLFCSASRCRNANQHSCAYANIVNCMHRDTATKGYDLRLCGTQNCSSILSACDLRLHHGSRPQAATNLQLSCTINHT